MTLVRRGFLKNACVAATTLLGSRGVARAAAISSQTSGAEARLAELGIELPEPPSPVATYVPAVRVGELLFVSGMGPRRGGSFLTGKVGADLMQSLRRDGHTQNMSDSMLDHRELWDLFDYPRWVETEGRLS